jgi:hypothetical protein
MQYRYIPSIPLTINQSPAYFFVDATTIPRGLTFNATTGTFTGMPVLTGTSTVRIYVTIGGANYNYFDFSFHVFPPYPQKRQDVASAYTAYVRQEAVIAGARFSRDSRRVPESKYDRGCGNGSFAPRGRDPSPTLLYSTPSVKND